MGKRLHLCTGTTERERIIAALRAAEGSINKASKMLKMPRRTLYRRIREYGLAVT